MPGNRFAAVLLALAACAAPPVEITFTGPKSDVRLAIAMQPNERSQRTQLYYYYSGVWFEEGEIVHDAALDEFGKRFQSVAPREKAGQFDAVVEVEGDSILNPQFSTYYATATARTYSPDGKLLGTYKATASAYANFGNLEYDHLYRQTYAKAFAEVAQQLASSDAMKTMETK
jgi:hypothetical protein